MRKQLPELVQITVSVDRGLLSKLLAEAARDGRSAVDVVRERLEGSMLQQIKGELAGAVGVNSGVRPKRPNGTLHAFGEKLIIRVPLPTKCEWMRLARENLVTQDELGWIIVRAVLADQAWLAEVLAVAQQEKQQHDAVLAGRCVVPQPGQQGVTSDGCERERLLPTGPPAAVRPVVQSVRADAA